MNKINSPSSKNALKPAPDSDTFLNLFFFFLSGLYLLENCYTTDCH